MAPKSALQKRIEKLEEDVLFLKNEYEKRMQNQLRDERYRKRTLVDDSIDDPAKKDVPAEDIILARNEEPKTFVMKYVFPQVPTLKLGNFRISPQEEHHGLQWQMRLSRENDFLYLCLYCLEYNPLSGWSVDLKFQVKVIGNNRHPWSNTLETSVGNLPYHTSTQFIEWDKLSESGFLTDGSLTLVFEVTLIRMTGTGVAPASTKTFSMSHVFGKVMELGDYGKVYSPSEEHYGVSWNLSITRNCNNFEVDLNCTELQKLNQNSKRFSIEMLFRFELVDRNGKNLYALLGNTLGYSETGAFNFGSGIKKLTAEVTKSFFTDGSLTVKVCAFIRKTKNLYERNLLSFDESDKPHSDVVLAVQNTRFYVLKEILAKHSSVFKEMLFGGSKKAKRSEVQLPAFDPSDVNIYLELLYKVSNVLDEKNVEGVSLIGNFMDTRLVRRKAEEFLIEKSKKPLQKKFAIFLKYNLNLMKLLPEIKTLSDVRSILPSDPTILKSDFMAALLKICIASE